MQNYAYPEWVLKKEKSATTLDCDICYEEVDVKDSYWLSCKHKFCRECYINHAKEGIKSGMGCVDLVCP